MVVPGSNQVTHSAKVSRFVNGSQAQKKIRGYRRSTLATFAGPNSADQARLQACRRVYDPEGRGRGQEGTERSTTELVWYVALPHGMWAPETQPLIYEGLCEPADRYDRGLVPGRR